MIGMNTFGNTVSRDQQQQQLSFWNSNAFGFILDTGDNPQSGQITAMAKHPDGKIIVAGIFSKYNGVAVKQIVRLNANLTLDTSFDPVGAGVVNPAYMRNNLPLTEVDKIYALSDGRVILTYGSGTRDRPFIDVNQPFNSRDNVHPSFVVLSSDGSLDSSHATYRKTFIDNWVASTYYPNYHATPGNTNWGMFASVSLVKNDEFLIQSYQQNNILHFSSNGAKKKVYELGSSHYAIPIINGIKLDSTGKLWAVGQLSYYEESYSASHLTSHNTTGFTSKEDQAFAGHFGGVWTWNSDGTRDKSTFRGGFYLGPNVNMDYPTGLNIDSNDNIILIVARRPTASRYLPTIKNNGSDPAVNINDYNKISHPSLFTVKQDGSPVGTITNSAIVNDPLDWTSALQGLNARSEILRLDNGSWAIGDDAARAGLSVFMPDTKTHHQTLVVIDSSGNTNANINGRASRSQTEPESNFLHGVIGDPLNYVNTGIFSIVQLDSDSILVGGKFSSYDGVARNMIMQFNVTTGAIESPATY